MSQGIHGHGHGHGHGHHLGIKRHGSGQFKKLEQKNAQGGTTPAEQAGGMDQAMAALDQAIKGLAVSLQKDSYNGQPAPDGVQSASSGLTNPGNLQADTYTPASASAPVASAPVASAPAPSASPLNNPILDAKGGGGVRGGVIGSYLDAVGGGGVRGGVIGS